jgi:threonine dehydrogenase-like Zn-dependent dehydrogenase
MKIGAILKEGKAGMIEVPDPVPKEDFVLVKVHIIPICTEWKGFHTVNSPFKSGDSTDHPVFPRSGFGHEAVGEVVEVAQPGQVKVGDRVVVQPFHACGKCPLCLNGDHIHCQYQRDIRAITGSTNTGTYAQYVLKSDWLQSPIPDSVSYKHAGMALCGLGPTFGAMQQMGTNSLDTILITGLGPVGLGGVINARHRGARVIGVESHPYRVRIAKELGAEVVLDPKDENILKQILELTDGIGVDKAVDCSGLPQAQRLMIDATRRKGQAAFVGEGGEFPLGASRDMIRKGLTLRGNWHYNIGDYYKIMKVIKETPQQLNKLITHTFPLSELQKAWELQVTMNCGKVILDPWK